MNVEQRLHSALRSVERVEPSADLWSRVVHSIDENRAHRRRVTMSVMVTLLVLAGLVAAGAASLRSGRFGYYVNRPVMEALELIGLVVIVIVLGPAIRRFGRNFAQDLFPREQPLATMLLRLLDVAYYLVFAAYVLMTTQFEFRLGVIGMPASRDLAQQLREAAVRFGGLLLLMGALHAMTLVALPFVALVHNSTLRRRPLPRWLQIAGTVLIAWLGLQIVGGLLGLLVIGLQ